MILDLKTLKGISFIGLVMGSYVPVLAQLPRYTIETIPTPATSNTIFPSSINNNGVVVGAGYGPKNGRDYSTGFLYQNHIVTDFGFRSTRAINDAGQIAGGNGIWQNGSWQDFPQVGSYYGMGYAINQRGDVAGGLIDQNGAGPAFVYQNGVLINIGALADNDATAYGINDLGAVVGSSIHAFVYRNGTMQDLGALPGGIYSDAYDINNAGLIVGSSENANGRNEAVIFEGGGKLKQLGTLGGPFSYAYAVNEAGDIVGDAATSTYDAPFLYRGGTMYNLFSAVDNLDGWRYGSATGINERGQVVGWGNKGAFLLTPVPTAVPEPGGIGLLVGLGVGVWWLRRRTLR